MTDSYETLDGNYSHGSGPQMNGEDVANLRKAGKWARFVGIFGMIMLGLGIFSIVAFSGTMLAFVGMSGTGQGGGIFLAFIGLFYLGMFAFSFYLIYLQYRFGQSAMQAADHGDGQALTTALASLARLFKIVGVIFAVYLAFMAFWIVVMILGGAAAMFG